MGAGEEGFLFSMWCRISFFVILPPLPVPSIDSSSFKGISLWAQTPPTYALAEAQQVGFVRAF